jgi:hypothetical protein
MGNQRKLLAGIEKRLETGDFAAKEQQDLKDIDEKIASLKYNADEHGKHEKAVGASGIEGKENTGGKKRTALTH